MKLKQGCMAFFIKCPNEPANIGLPVTLLKRGCGNRSHQWLVEGNIKHAGEKAKHCTGGEEIPYRRAWANAEWLAPIDGDSTEPDESTAYLPPVLHEELA